MTTGHSRVGPAAGRHGRPYVPPLYLGVAAQFSFSAKLRHRRLSGFSISRASWSLRRMTILSPAASFVLACPSQNSVVPGFTFDAVMRTVPADEMTTGRKDRL